MLLFLEFLVAAACGYLVCRFWNQNETRIYRLATAAVQLTGEDGGEEAWLNLCAEVKRDNDES